MKIGYDWLIIIPKEIAGPPQGIYTEKQSIWGGTKEHLSGLENKKHVRLHELMSRDYGPTQTGPHYKSDGSSAGSEDRNCHLLKIILTRNVQNLGDDPFYRETVHWPPFSCDLFRYVAEKTSS